MCILCVPIGHHYGQFGYGYCFWFLFWPFISNWQLYLHWPIYLYPNGKSNSSLYIGYRSLLFSFLRVGRHCHSSTRWRNILVHRKFRDESPFCQHFQRRIWILGISIYFLSIGLFFLYLTVVQLKNRNR